MRNVFGLLCVLALGGCNWDWEAFDHGMRGGSYAQLQHYRDQQQHQQETADGLNRVNTELWLLRMQRADQLQRQQYEAIFDDYR